MGVSLSKTISAILAIAALLQTIGPVHAQLSKADKERVAASIAADVNREIHRQLSDDTALREKVISRLFECGYVFLYISKQAGAIERKAEIQDAGEISFELAALLSGNMPVDRFKQIGNAATQSIKNKFAAPITQAGELEMNILSKNCQSFQKIDAVSGAVAALLPPVVQDSKRIPIEFANELQECSLYYTLLATALILRVPKKSGPLSLDDQDAVVKSQVYMTKSEQIDVLYRRLALLAGAESSLKQRREIMFEKEKRVMTDKWIVRRLDERYKDICEYILSDAGSKARLKEISEGNVCGRLYTCW